MNLPASRRWIEVTTDFTARAHPALVRFSLVCAIGYWLFLVIMTHTPLPISLPHNSDKLAHFGAYFVLALCVFAANWLGGTPLGVARKRTLWLCCVWGIFDELTQIPIPGRFGDPRDAVADWVGAFAGVAVATLLVRRAARWWGNSSDVS